MQLNLKACYDQAKKNGKKVSKTELAHLLFPTADFPLIAYNRLESGRSKGIKLNHISIIMDYLDCKLDELFRPILK